MEEVRMAIKGLNGEGAPVLDRLLVFFLRDMGDRGQMSWPPWRSSEVAIMA